MRGTGVPLWLAATAVFWLALLAGPAFAQDRAELIVTAEKGFARLIVDFPQRFDLPKYKIAYDNGVLAVTFDEPVNLVLPDVSGTLPAYVAAARVDPDNRGVRFGLRFPAEMHSMEAGERLYIDLLPPGWKGLPPSLPQEVVAELTERAKDAAKALAQKRKAEATISNNPTATLSVSRNPTFLRLQFDWNTDADASFEQTGDIATLGFSWPVPIDLYPLTSDLPAEMLAATNKTTKDGSNVVLTVAKGIVPRFYAVTPRQFIVDIDLSAAEITARSDAAEQEARAIQQAQIEAQQKALAKNAADTAADAASPETDAMNAEQTSNVAPITPIVADVAGTIRVTFPFDRDTASAVFRRGDTVWMLFDTPASINPPAPPDALSAIAKSFTIIPAGKTQIVRLDLAVERLATLGSEGRSWVLSLGDILLNATEPLALDRERDKEGHFEITADLGKPAAVHSFRDPVVGDMLDVVTIFPPARGAVRNLSFVDFEALKSIHGLVVRPASDGLDVAIEGNLARISLEGGLTLSDRSKQRSLDGGDAAEFRASFVDLVTTEEPDPQKLMQKREELSQAAATSEGKARDLARLNLAQFYVGNQLAYEAIGVLEVTEPDLQSDELRKKTRLTLAIADTLATRPRDALKILGTGSFGEEVDAVMWRTIARADAYDFVGARTDAIAAEPAIEAYPMWVRQKFLFAAIRAAVETSDVALAQKFLDRLDFAKLSPEDTALYQLFQGRIAEAQGRQAEAIDTYGQVIAAEFRPTRAEAVYRTVLLLQDSGKVDTEKATATLASEALLWRGNPLEADMQGLLAKLYFKNGEYREGFDTVKAAVAYYPESAPINDLLDESRTVFGELYLNGASDKMGDVDALSLFYDFRQLTPAGSRGDEMIRNLARRLVKVDLLSQAGDLLEYQIDNRLKGIAQAQVAADLALIRLADRNPEAALRVLNRTRIAELPPAIDRQRRILEARALIDADRQELALELLNKIDGRDADLLRVDAFWQTKNYAAASDLIETIYSGDEGVPLSEPARLNILKAGVGLVLADDKLGLSRIRAKFSDRMAQSAEWAMFDYITSPDAEPDGEEFKKAAHEVSGIDSLSAFLDAYKAVYTQDPAIEPAAPTPPASV